MFENFYKKMTKFALQNMILSWFDPNYFMIYIRLFELIVFWCLKDEYDGFYLWKIDIFYFSNK